MLERVEDGKSEVADSKSFDGYKVCSDCCCAEEDGKDEDDNKMADVNNREEREGDIGDGEIVEGAEGCRIDEVCVGVEKGVD